MISARLAAARVLVAVERGRTTLAAEVDRAREDVGVRDRSLFLEIVAGTLRWQNELDAALQAVSKRPIAQLDVHARAVLRIGAYQLRHLDRVPVHAIVHESVEDVRTLGHPRAAGFVNAVLRSLSRLAHLPLPARPMQGDDRDAARAYLSVTLSHPEWLVARWLERYGFEAALSWCRFNNAPPDLVVRSARGLSGDRLLAALRAVEAAAQPARFVRDAVQVPAGSLGRLGAAWRDDLVVQEETSQIVAQAVGARPGHSVLDLCASPGAKTAILGRSLERNGVLVASDHRPARVALLSATLRRTATTAAVVRLDATHPLPFRQTFDRVLVDAPCSGLGVLRRDPDLKWSRRPDDLPALAAVQFDMLSHAAAVVRPGGHLVYATCSSEPEENEHIVDRFLAAHSAFELLRTDPGPAVADAGVLIDERGFLRTLPFLHGLDAFFAATLRRR